MTDGSPTDLCERLVQRLDALEAAPVGEHPDALDEVHRAVVAELDALAGSAARAAAEPR